MVIRIALNKRNLVIAVVAVMAMGTASFVIYHLVRNQTNAPAKYYAQQLDKLGKDIKTVNSLNEDEHDKSSLADQIKEYNTSLSNMINTCQDLDKHYNSTKDNPAYKSLREHTDKVNKLCSDLSTVVGYARKQSEATKDFILFPVASLNQDGLAKFQGTLSTAQSSLEPLNSDPIKDPAVSEQLTLIKELQQLVQDAVADPSKLDALVKKVKIHQTNFFNARTYFWKNTIEIDKLQRVIAIQRSSFK